jgi:uncharacterized protein
MQQLYSAFYQQLSRVSVDFKRYLYNDINWNSRLIAITGSRGTGKTTLLLQHIKLNEAENLDEVLYVSLDNLWFSTHSLLYLVDEFTKRGGKRLYLDEVHFYKGWSRELKNSYDSYPDLKIVFTGSSLLEIHKGEGDLSRRLINYTLYGLSFREFIEYEYDLKFDSVKIEDILSNHVELSLSVTAQLKPLVAFYEYLRFGYFPYYKEDKELYHLKLMQTLNTIFEKDLPAVESIDYYSVVKIKKLFSIISTMVPYTPNVSQLSRDIGTTRTSLLNYLHYLDKANALTMLSKDAFGIKQMTKPEKIFIGNTNYAFAMGGEQTNIGSVRESFFMNQMKVKNRVDFSEKADFIVSGKYTFEIGGKNKTKKQISGQEDAYIAVDNIETGFGNQIPLWLIGFNY